MRLGRCIRLLMQSFNLSIEHSSHSWRCVSEDISGFGQLWSPMDPVGHGNARGLWNICSPSSTFFPAGRRFATQIVAIGVF